jgi:hypothetical protein
LRCGYDPGLAAGEDQREGRGAVYTSHGKAVRAFAGAAGARWNTPWPVGELVST